MVGQSSCAKAVNDMEALIGVAKPCDDTKTIAHKAAADPAKIFFKLLMAFNLN